MCRHILWIEQTLVEQTVPPKLWSALDTELGQAWQASYKLIDTAVQSETAVTAYLKSKQLLLFVFVLKNTKSTLVMR